MPFINPPHSLRALLTALCLALCLVPCVAWGEDGEETLDLFNAWQQESSTASRAPKPLSQTAENVSVVTRSEIEALNAHTLADVLATIPGVQTEHLSGPGSVVFPTIQGTQNNHVLVMVDGVPLNTFGENFSDISSVPARIIERVEVVKGAASSVWGQALGGVINVITKSPEQRTISGSVASSIGSSTTTDNGVELSGTKERLGYYLSGGYLGSDGIVPHISTYANNAYAKLTYDLPAGGQLWGTFNYSHSNRANLFVPLYDLKETQQSTYITATLGMRYRLSERLDLELTGRHAYRAIDTSDNNISDGAFWNPTIITRERMYGGNAKLVWRGDNNLLVVGGEYDRAELASNGSQVAFDTLTRTADRWGVYLNDTITLGALTLIPGARFDRSNITPDQYSPSFGATYRLGESTLLRGYTARGYSQFSFTLNRVPEKVWTSQVGIESSIVPYLWQKLTLFRNETWDIGATLDRRISLGTEYEIRTAPVYNTSIGAGYIFADTKLTSTNTQVFGVPRHTLHLALRYNDETFRGTLTGRHIYWNSDPADPDKGHYQGLIWDLHLGASLYKRENSSLEIFFSGHNLFNGQQSTVDLTPSPGRWFEGGMKVRF